MLNQIRRLFGIRRKPIRALMLTPSLLMGGAERWLVSLARHCDRSRINWVGCVCGDWTACNPIVVEDLGRVVSVFGSESVAKQSPGIVQVESAKAILRHAIESKAVDVIVTWGFHHLGDVLPRDLSRRVPVVYVSHTGGEWTWQAVRECEKFCTHFAAVSESAARAFSDPNYARCKSILNGIDEERCLRSAVPAETRKSLGIDDRVVVGHVGRFAGEKNCLAIAEAVANMPDGWALYCGEGPIKHEIKAHAKKITCGRATFLEHRSQVGDVFALLDCFMLATKAEGHSLALTEAWYCGCPTVSTLVGATPEITRDHGQVTTIVDPAASGGDLARAIRQAIASPEVTANAQRVTLAKFLSPHMADRWCDYLEEIVR